MNRNWFIKLLIFIATLSSLTLFAFSKTSLINYNQQENEFIVDQPANIIQKIQNKKAGLYYFGFKECPWCQALQPHLIDTLKANKRTAYLINTRSKDFSDKERKVITEIYRHYLDGDRLYVPFLIAINSAGNMKVHMGTVKNHDANHEELTKTQIKELKKILEQLIYYANS